MFVVKRNGSKQKVFFDKISHRVSKLCYGFDNKFVQPLDIVKKVIAGLYNGVTTSELDELAAETSANLVSTHPDYAILASRLIINNLHKNTKKNFSDVISALYQCVHPKTNELCPLISTEVYTFIINNSEELNSAIIYDRDYKFDYFGFKTFQKSYLLKMNGKVVERPQHLFMRVACELHINDVKSCLETYEAMSNFYFIHATPTLYNAGNPQPQLSSCFLQTIHADSIKGIYKSLADCADISQKAGGIGLAVHKIRATGSYISGTSGIANGLVPMLRVFNNTARYVDQGGGKRKGAFAIYLEPWHADIIEFLDLKKNNGAEEFRARDLFYSLWIPDLFMRRVENNENWSLFCPKEAPGLFECWGTDFEQLYESYESKPQLIRKTLPARTVWNAILQSQSETGLPYMLYKDACNRKSNQQNLGTIQCSNLCCEIVQFTSPIEIAVCNLASIALNMFVENDRTFNFEKLFQITKQVTYNLNKVIDRTYYPVKEACTSNQKHRPIGIGCQGLDDCFKLMRFPFKSKKAKILNIDIFETMYFAACTASMELAMKDGPYESYQGSPMSQGKFQFDLWGVTPQSNRWNWTDLREKVMKHGMRNSLLIAPMPTASTSQILGNNEAFEPFTSNIYVRRTSAGEFVRMNKHLVKDLIELNLWCPEVKDQLVADDGSVQNIDCIPQDLKELYETAFEISSKVVIDMAADRGPYVCQSQSMNIHMNDITPQKLTSMHFYGWKKGLKTGMYYLRGKAATNAVKVTLDVETVSKMQLKRKKESTVEEEQSTTSKQKKVCSLLDRENCDSCGA